MKPFLVRKIRLASKTESDVLNFAHKKTDNKNKLTDVQVFNFHASKLQGIPGNASARYM